MKLATLAYIPPASIPYAGPFLRNVTAHKPRHELLLYSDYQWPDVRQLEGSPEVLKGDIDGRGREKPYSISNLVFYTGMMLAEKAGFTHVLYVEADSRVYGAGWDDAIFEEFFTHKGAIIGGSVAVHNPANSGIEGLRKWQDLVARNTRRNYPIPTYGNMGTADMGPSCVFCYGSGSVIDMGWWKELFSKEERSPEVQSGELGHQFGFKRPFLDARNGGAEGFGMMKIARASVAWDVEIGRRIWNLFGPDSYDMVAHLGQTVFSSYGNVLTSEKERLDMLPNGSARLVHQVKSATEI